MLELQHFMRVFVLFKNFNRYLFNIFLKAINGYYYNFNYSLGLSGLNLNHDSNQYLNFTDQYCSKSLNEASVNISIALLISFLSL